MDSPDRALSIDINKDMYSHFLLVVERDRESNHYKPCKTLNKPYKTINKPYKTI